jgi:hypothetical protein
LRRTGVVRRAGEPQQRLIDPRAMGIHRTRHPDHGIGPLRMDGVAVVEVMRRPASADFYDAAAAVVVGVALGHGIRSGSCRRQQVIERVPHQRQRGRPRAGGHAVAGRSGHRAAAGYFAQLCHMPVGVMHRRPGQRAGARGEKKSEHGPFYSAFIPLSWLLSWH